MLTPPPEVERIVKIASGFHYFLALREDGEAFVWGDENWKKDKELSFPNGRLQGIKDIDIDQAGGMHAVTFEGKVVSWGNSKINYFITTKQPKKLKDVDRIRNAVGFTKSGELIPWAVYEDGDACLELPKGLQKVRDVVFATHLSLAIQQNGKVVGINRNSTLIDLKFGSLKKKVTQAAGVGGGPGILLLFEDATVQYFDFHDDFRDYEKNSHADYAVNYEKVAKVLSIGGLEEGFWAILKEDKAEPKKAKTSKSNKKK
jgi:hypothetical protein